MPAGHDLRSTTVSQRVIERRGTQGRFRQKLTCFVALYFVLATSAFAEPYVEHLEPPSVCRGQQNRIALVGQDVDRVVGLWTSLPAGKVEVVSKHDADQDRSELELKVAVDCPLGIYGLRLATEDGLSNLALFVVDDLAPMSVPHQSTITLPAAISGELRPASQDRYTLQVAAGQTLTFDVISSRLGPDADPLVTVSNAAGRMVVQRDNDPGLFYDTCFEHTFAVAGQYTVEVRDARYEGSPHWRYVLRVGEFPTARLAIPSTFRVDEKTSVKFPELGGEAVEFIMPKDSLLAGQFIAVRRPHDQASNWAPVARKDLASLVEVEPNDAPDRATATTSAPLILHGVIDKPGDQDQFAITVNKGDKFTFRAETRPLNSAADVELVFYDPTGKEVLRNDDVTLPGAVLDEASLTFNGGKEGVYRLVVREMTRTGGPQYSYRVTVLPQRPQFTLSSDVASAAVPQGSYQRLPVTVVRTNYAGPIELELVGAPAGVKLEPTTIPEGATSLEAKLIAESSVSLGLATLAILGKAQAGDVELTATLTVQPLVDRQLHNVDLIKYALRDNQRWLPPSVTQSIALQVLPPAPFTVEMDDPLVVLPRYLFNEVKINTTRTSDFTAPIEISASGGNQLGEESQGRRQVYGRYKPATAAEPVAIASFYSRSQANEVKERCDLKAVGKLGSRTTTLYRSFTLDCRPAFKLTPESSSHAVEPGQTAKVKLLVERWPTFHGAVEVNTVPSAQLTFPELLTIAADSNSVEFDVTVPATAKPGKQKIRVTGISTVAGFQEELRPIDVEIEIKPAAKT